MKEISSALIDRLPRPPKMAITSQKEGRTRTGKGPSWKERVPGVGSGAFIRGEWHNSGEEEHAQHGEEVGHAAAQAAAKQDRGLGARPAYCRGVGDDAAAARPAGAGAWRVGQGGAPSPCEEA